MTLITKALLVTAVLLFVACLSRDAVVFDRTCPISIDSPANSAPVAGLNNPALGETSTHQSLSILLFGWLGFSLGAVGWFANPCAVFAFVYLIKGRIKNARLFAVGAFFLAAVSLYVTNIFYLIGDEGGVCRLSALSALSGYWLWLAAFAVLVLASFTATPFHSEQKAEQ